MGWKVKKCCNDIEKELDIFDWWIDEGKVMVILHEGDPELETIFELEKCPSCGSKMICYQVG